MSREIKFRAFDKTLFKMFEPRTLRDIAKEAPNNGVNWYQFEMMQFTGLTDNNGVDAYEGDIITMGDSVKSIEFRLKGNGFCADEEGFPAVGFYFVQNTWGIPLSIFNEFEITGNIYEHGHLLKG